MGKLANPDKATGRGRGRPKSKPEPGEKAPATGPGRPIKFSKKEQAKFLYYLSEGETVTTACSKVGIDTSTYRKERLRNPTFAKQADEAKDSRVQNVEDVLYVTALTGNIQAITFFLANRAPEKWQSINRVQATIDGNINNNVSGQIDITHRLAGMDDKALQIHIKNLALLAENMEQEGQEPSLADVLFDGQTEAGIIESEFYEYAPLSPNPENEDAPADDRPDFGF